MNRDDFRQGIRQLPSNGSIFRILIFLVDTTWITEKISLDMHAQCPKNKKHYLIFRN